MYLFFTCLEQLDYLMAGVFYTVHTMHIMKKCVRSTQALAVSRKADHDQFVLQGEVLNQVVDKLDTLLARGQSPGCTSSSGSTPPTTLPPFEWPITTTEDLEKLMSCQVNVHFSLESL